MYKLRALPVFVVVALFLFSCKGGNQDNVSPTTGWSYRDPKSSDVNDLGYPIGEASEQVTGPNLVLIEGGTFTMGRVEQDVMFDWNNSPRRVTVSSFYMDETEITNLDYREYLYWLRRVYSDYPEVHRRALPDTLVWRSPLGLNEPYVQYWDNFNLSLLLFLVLMTIYYVSSLYKQPDWKYEEGSRSMKAKVIKYGFRFLLVSFVLNLFASIWI